MCGENLIFATAMTRKTLLALQLLLAPFACICAQSTKFAYLSDTHISHGSHSVQDLRLCIEDINSLDSLDFVIVGGDITDFGSDEQIFLAKSMLDSLKYKYWVVAGNHDAKWSESGCNTFRNAFGYEHFEFEHGGWRFLGCNSGPDMRMAPALLPRESMDWLDSLEPDKKSIFINHYPQDSSVLNYFDVTRALKRAGVQLEIGGHWHQNRSMDFDGIPAVLGRSSMSDRRRNAGYNIFTLGPSHVSIRERSISPDGKAEETPWYDSGLMPVADTVNYDAAGISSSYPWLRYDVNERWPEVKELWKFTDDSNIAGGFARAGRKAWYATSSGKLRCIRLSDGKILWSKSFPGKIFSTPAVCGKYLVLGCTDGGIYAVDSRSGRPLWSVMAGKSVLGSPVIFDGKVFIGASDGTFRALNLENGAEVWKFDGVEGFVECRAFVDAGQVVFGAWDGRLYCLDTGSGRLLWTWNSPKQSRMYSPAATWPVKAAGRIFIAVPDRKVYALDSYSGKELFRVDGGRESIGLSSDGSTVLVKTMFNTSYAFRADVAAPSGQELPQDALLWKTANGTHYEISPSPVVEADGTVIVPTDKGNLFALSLEDGRPLWCHKMSLATVNPVEVWRQGGYGLILASAMDGTVTMLKVPVQTKAR